ncbi:MAG: hypothetical protein JWN70_1348 [Planctomycetaceae bacterium]|nr:hypothetical protein [Planctomycetaceae bacterium]
MHSDIISADLYQCFGSIAFRGQTEQRLGLGKVGFNLYRLKPFRLTGILLSSLRYDEKS